jgi:hypothetical protein
VFLLRAFKVNVANKMSLAIDLLNTPSLQDAVRNKIST